MVIDIYSHHLPQAIAPWMAKEKYYGAGKQLPYPLQNADPEVRLGLMDKYGVQIQALSQTTPVLLGFNAEDAAEICKISNDANYALCKAFPNKFVNMCILSLLDVKSALKELDRSINELDCRGVTISTNQKGKVACGKSGPRCGEHHRIPGALSFLHYIGRIVRGDLQNRGSSRTPYRRNLYRERPLGRWRENLQPAAGFQYPRKHQRQG